ILIVERRQSTHRPRPLDYRATRLDSSTRILYFSSLDRRTPRPTLFPYTTLFRSKPRSICAPQGLRNGIVGKRLSGEQSAHAIQRSEEHTSELQSRENLVCRLLLEKKNHHRRADPRRGRTRNKPDTWHGERITRLA